MKVSLSNDILEVTIDSFGAEIQSIVNKRTGENYLWSGDKRFWGRRSPVLFPIVGQVWQGTYRMDGCEYKLGQHGFARDREFTPVADTPEDEAWFCLDSDEETRKVYPRDFRLSIGYRLQEARLTVMWRVENVDAKSMSFQIGAHPAFNYPAFNPSDPVHGYLAFDNSKLTSQMLEGAWVGESTAAVELDEEEFLPLTAETFAALPTIILANGQVHRVSMLDKERRPYLTMLFNAPVVGIWSPAADAPFVCLEPWWGRADRTGFDGDFSEREYVNTLLPGRTFDTSYMIIIDNL